MEEYDKMLAGEYHYPFKDGVPNEYMKKLQEKARIDLEKYNAIPNSDYESKLACLKSISKECGQQWVLSQVQGKIVCNLGSVKGVF